MALQDDTGRYNASVEHIRDDEYPMIQDSVYLDHAGSTLPAKSVMDAFAAEMSSVLYGNPHSGSGPSQLSTSRIEDIRLRLLAFFNADPEDYDLVFVANATAGVKLVLEAMRAQPGGFRYAYHDACHTSLVGARQEAYESVCLDETRVDSWIDATQPFTPDTQAPETTLFAFSAQSHMDGTRYPLSWPKQLKNDRSTTNCSTYTLLDAASFCATSPLQLDSPDFAADFTVLSLYKIFGFPDLGALIVRRSAEHVFDRRRYFGGGTVEMVLCDKEQWHAPKTSSLHERLEDGTLPFHNIISLDAALTIHRRLFGSMTQVKAHTSYLTKRLVKGLAGLHHENGQAVCQIYGKHAEIPSGPVISFNILNSMGAWLSLAEFEKLANVQKMHVRTGGLCSPGGIASALALQPWEMKSNFSAGFRCGTENDIVNGKPTGVIRASLGAMSTISDVDRFVTFLNEYFVEKSEIDEPLTDDRRLLTRQSNLRVKSVTVYPIKSCGGIEVSHGSSWGIRPEGLAWDREWCLIHRGSRQALSQKRYPRMALLKPELDFQLGLLRVKYTGGEAPFEEVTVPLSENPALFDALHRQSHSKVCGDEISAQTYASKNINDFFSRVLEVPCVLARFPAGGRGSRSRVSKARMQRHQDPHRASETPSTLPDLPSPPDSDSEKQDQGKILLSNESPILMIHSASVDALNRDMLAAGQDPVPDSAFRANVVLETAPGEDGEPPYAEDSWTTLRIGSQRFRLLGACRRCQMVCVDQQTARKSAEPFSTLAKTRRFDGKVYFGVHMRHEPLLQQERDTQEDQHPTISIGDTVQLEDYDGQL